jgi:hypothetical protein
MKDGVSMLRDHLEAAARQGSREAQAELLAPDLPLAGAHLWQWFLELNAARTSNGWGPNAIGYAELDAWARLTRRAPAVHEIDALRALDRAFMESAAERSKEDKK